MRAATLAGVLSLTIAASSSPSAPQAQPKASTRATELLSWLPTDTETVVVTQTPAMPGNGPLFEVIPFAEINFGSKTSGPAANRQLRGFSVTASVEGARHFRPPSGLGEMRYEGATLYLLDKPLGAQGGAAYPSSRKVPQR